tara:strand:- start:1959 stop:2876 length:918 start_codon:yes stop_codon:yes gene_type:complete
MADEQPEDGFVEEETEETEEKVAPEKTEEAETEEEVEDDAEQEEGDETEEDSDEEQTEAVSDTETVEFEGKEYNVPQELKDALLRNKDYTIKTQEVAEQRKELEADRDRFQEALQLQTAHTQTYTELGVIDQQLAQFNEIDWEQWRQTDPNATQQAQIQLNQLREQRTQTVDKLNSLQTETQQKHQAEIARVVEQNRAKVEKSVPNWNQDTEKAVFDYGIKRGLTENQLANTNYDPVLIGILNDARLFDELKQKQNVKKTKKKTEPVPQATRVTKAKKTQNRGLHDGLSTEEWVRRRNAQIAKRG